MERIVTGEGPAQFEQELPPATRARPRRDFRDTEGNVYWRTAEPEALMPTRGESVTLYFSPKAGRIMIDYALRPDGSLLIGYEMAK